MQLHTQVVKLLVDGRQVTGVVTNRGTVIHAKIVIDATEYGDLLPMSPAMFADAIALGDYGNDLHGCSAEENLEHDLEHDGDRVGDRGLATGPFQIPMGVLIPHEVDGLLLAEKNISQSRLANGATRLQPSTMVVGQASGALAVHVFKLAVIEYRRIERSASRENRSRTFPCPILSAVSGAKGWETT